MSGTWLVLIVCPFRRLSVKEKEAGNFNLRHSPERLPLLIMITRELARGLTLIVGAVQVHKRDHLREVRLYAQCLVHDISVYSPLSYLAPYKGNPHCEIREILPLVESGVVGFLESLKQLKEFH